MKKWHWAFKGGSFKESRKLRIKCPIKKLTSRQKNGGMHNSASL